MEMVEDGLRGGGKMGQWDDARTPGKGITLKMYIRNTQVNKKKKNSCVQWALFIFH